MTTKFINEIEKNVILQDFLARKLFKFDKFSASENLLDVAHKKALLLS